MHYNEIIENIEPALLDIVPETAPDWIGLFFIVLVWYQYYRVIWDYNPKTEPDGASFFATWTWTFIAVSVGYQLIQLIGGIFF